MSEAAKTLEDVKTYYGEVLASKNDLQTSACCPDDGVTPRIKEVLLQIEDEILEKSYGCGSPIPEALAGCTVLDLGCGTGRDVYIASKLVGPNGKAIGVDMTSQQLEVARKHVEAQAKKFGYSTPNVEFRHGLIEDLAGSGLADNSVDIVISNCVINLSPDKKKVFSEIFRVLKPGGELYFSDVFSDRRISEELQSDPVLRGECLSGALYIEDFRRLLFDLGCRDFRVVNSRKLEITNPEIEARVGMINFSSQTIRAFKLGSIEDRCEDYGQTATYIGGVEESPHSFILDDHHEFILDKPMLVCSNTAAMLEETRFAKYFKITGDKNKHFGLFDCSDSSSSADVKSVSCC